jgi:hypothetical protein
MRGSQCRQGRDSFDLDHAVSEYDPSVEVRTLYFKTPCFSLPRLKPSLDIRADNMTTVARLPLRFGA